MLLSRVLIPRPLLCIQEVSGHMQLLIDIIIFAWHDQKWLREDGAVPQGDSKIVPKMQKMPVGLSVKAACAASS
jgi:hypothetical protein